jgi:hypothetical protein
MFTYKEQQDLAIKMLLRRRWYSGIINRVKHKFKEIRRDYRFVASGVVSLVNISLETNFCNKPNEKKIIQREWDLIFCLFTILICRVAVEADFTTRPHKCEQHGLRNVIVEP